MKPARVAPALLLALGVVICAACNSSTSTFGSGRPLENLTLGTSKIDLSSLIWIAKERGYFADQCLDITFKLYESGHLAVKDLLAGDLDLATATEFATVRGFMKRPDLRIVSILDRSEDQRLIARKDRGVTEVSDLRGKRIGLAEGSSSEYYLHIMAILNDVPLSELEIVNLLPSEQVKAITEGEIDAALVWQPFAAAAERGLGANAVSWSAQSGLKDYWLLLSTNDVVEKRSRAIRRVLDALASAEDLIKKNDTKAMRIVAKELGAKFEDSLWQNHRFRLGLNRLLLLKIEAEATWIQARQRSRVFSMPDLLELMYFDGLKSVRPEKVELLH